MSSNPSYYKSEVEFDLPDLKSKDPKWTVNKLPDNKYTYDEAITLAGTGFYSYYLMLTSGMSMLSMTVDIFGFSVVVGGSRCEFPLDLHQKSILMSLPFLGPVLMSYAWGYLCDTKGRRRCMSLAMWGSFIASGLVAFSPHYVVSGILKLISSSFSSCAQSATYALLGESTTEPARGYFMLMVTGFLNMCFSTYIVLAFFILNAEFSFPVFGYIVLPWRVLALALALPMGISGLLLQFVYESPKFLANAGKKEEAVCVLAHIWQRNGMEGQYPVTAGKLDFVEDINISSRRQPFLTSLWQQTVPLFKPPLLLRTLQLFYLTNIFFSVSNSLTVWFPFIAEAFFNGLQSSSEDTKQGLCLMLDQAKSLNTTSAEVCTTTIDVKTVYGGLGQGVSYLVIMLIISTMAARKKMLMLSLLSISCVCGAASVLIPNNLVDFIMFFGLLLNNLCMGIVFSYFVDLYPTSYRGMIACLGTIVARCSSLVGINVIGVSFINYCSITIYACTGYIFSGLLVSIFLPPDKPNNSNR